MWIAQVWFAHSGGVYGNIKHSTSLRLQNCADIEDLNLLCFHLPVHILSVLLSLNMKYLTLVSLMLGTAFADYASEAESAIKLLQNKWYSTETGLW